MSDDIHDGLTPEAIHWHNVGLAKGWAIAWKQVEVACVLTGNTDGADYARNVGEMGVAQVEALNADQQGSIQ